VAGLIAVTAQWEGKRNDPYRDIVGVWTVCYGETHGVQQRRYSDEECTSMLIARLGQFNAEIGRCITRPVPDNVRAAILSWAYNVGSDAACKSTLMRRLNAGDIAGACAELSRWTRAGGKVVKGLVNRRVHERALCEGVPPALGATG
jgi:GH24 family phage-related lysozyme (muramidase)